MTSADLTPEQWRQFHDRVMAHWRAAFDLCQHVVDAGFPTDDPVYHYCGALLGAACDLRRLVSAGMEGRPLPAIKSHTSMMMFVLPQAGGGCVPRKRG